MHNTSTYFEYLWRFVKNKKPTVATKSVTNESNFTCAKMVAWIYINAFSIFITIILARLSAVTQFTNCWKSNTLALNKMQKNLTLTFPVHGLVAKYAGPTLRHFFIVDMTCLIQGFAHISPFLLTSISRFSFTFSNC